MTKIVIALVVLTSIACGAGALPEPQRPLIFEKPGGFPSKSDDPWPLDIAIRQDRIDDVQALLGQGASPNERWGQRGDRFPLQEVFDTGNSYPVSNRTELVRLLLEHGADPNSRWCPFESRIDVDGKINCVSEKGTFALAWAAHGGLHEAVGLLVEAGADPAMQDWTGASALDYARDDITFELIARAQFPDIATRDQLARQWLSEERTGAYSATPWSATPISRALHDMSGVMFPPLPPIRWARFGPPTWENFRETASVVRLYTLLRVGVDPNERITRNGVDWTPLALALWLKQRRAARVLLAHGADVNQRWCVPVDYLPAREPRARTTGCTEAHGWTPLIWSTAEGRVEAVELLLEFGADVSLKDWAGRSALDSAQDPEIRKLLSERR